MSKLRAFSIYQVFFFGLAVTYSAMADARHGGSEMHFQLPFVLGGLRKVRIETNTTGSVIEVVAASVEFE